MKIRNRFADAHPARALVRSAARIAVVVWAVTTIPFFAQAAFAGGAVPALSVSGAWVRAVPPVSKNSAGYLVIENSGAQDVLLGAAVEGARVTEIHEMVRSGDGMAMRRRTELAVPAAGRVELAPGGLHLMLIDLQRPLQAGEKRGAVLRFRNAGDVNVVLDVRQ